MFKIKIRDKDYNCSNAVFYYIFGLKSENSLLSMELYSHGIFELKLQKKLSNLSSSIKDLHSWVLKNADFMDKEHSICEEILSKLDEMLESCDSDEKTI